MWFAIIFSQNSDEDSKMEKCLGDPSGVTLRVNVDSRGQSSALGPSLHRPYPSPSHSQEACLAAGHSGQEVGFRDGLPWAVLGGEGQQERRLLR